MGKDLIEIGEIEDNWNAAGTAILSYYAEVTHHGLKEHKVLKAKEEYILENKIDVQVQKWEDKWSQLEEKRLLKEHKEGRLAYAKQQTEAAKKLLNDLENTLYHTIEVDDTIDWRALKNHKEFSIQKPKSPIKPSYLESTLLKPERSHHNFNPRFSILEMIFPPLRKRKIRRMDSRFENTLNDWEKEDLRVRSENEKIDKNHESKIALWRVDVERWEKERLGFIEKRDLFNKTIDEKEASYKSKNPKAILNYCELVLNNSVYPEFFPQSFDIQYNEVTKILIVEYDLPEVEAIPKLKEVKYLISKDELVETYYSESVINKLYDSVIYQLALRTIHELFEADVIEAIELVSFNGWVNSISKATGNEERKCILSVQAKRNEFLEIDLSRVDPKTCFKSLKGVASSKLSMLTPIKPLIHISRDDPRFTDSYGVVDKMDESTNLAAMSWEDFEHLIRELFEKEFSKNGGEVNVTQASRDGGVDAIAFDPDPIRGGKIVIQAKRYTNTVGVSAIRDLYGTVMNEGATKGIIVTTANYGPDAYSFAQGKPLTLLNGANLLHLLEKHGHNAIIDIQKAKLINE